MPGNYKSNGVCTMSSNDQSMKSYKCFVCGYVYNPKEGDPEGNIQPGTPFEDLPDDWRCPLCSADKSCFEPLD